MTDNDGVPPAGKPARKKYREQLDEVKAELLEMGELALETINIANETLFSRSTEQIQEVKDISDRIDTMEFELEKRIVYIMALQQPMAGDLRALTASLRIINDLDRVSDLANNIAKIVREVGDEPWFKPLIDLPRMAEVSQNMLRMCLDAYMTGKIEGLNKLGKMDNIVDDLDNQIRSESVTYMIENPSIIPQASKMSFMARYLERIADHVTNVGSRIIYIYTGERKKLN